MNKQPVFQLQVIHPWWWLITRVVDAVMIPFMWAFSGFATWPPQSTHGWHLETHDVVIDPSLAVAVEGSDTSGIPRGWGGLFHLPLLGGWTKYAALSIQGSGSSWFVGWMVGDNRVQLQRLPLSSKSVKMLTGPIGSKTTFVAFDSSGLQIPLRLEGVGEMGDGQFAGIPFY